MTARAAAALAAPSKFSQTAVHCLALLSARSAAMPVMLGLIPRRELSLVIVTALVAAVAVGLFLLPLRQSASASRAAAMASPTPRRVLMAHPPARPAFP